MPTDRDEPFYVYEHWRPDTGACFYVGKGKGKRAHKPFRNRHHRNIVTKLQAAGLVVDVRITHRGLTEKQALTIEVERIAYWRSQGTKLTNLTDGGDGSSGWTASEETKARMSASHIGRTFSPETIERMRLVKTGKTISESTRKKLQVSHKGKKASPETREKMRLSQQRRWSNSGAKAKQSETITAALALPAVKEKLRSAQIRRFSDPVERAACRQYALKRWHSVGV